jgi:hypothetical protein
MVKPRVISTRTHLLNRIIATHRYRNYLEIGVRDPRQNFDRIRAPGIKHGVDPVPLAPITHPMTSDAFFAQSAGWYDLVFIDGMHLAEQVEKDVVNALAHLNDNGTIVLHDCNPLTADAQTEDYDGHKHWNGTVWKAWVKLRAQRDDLAMVVVDIDEGCGVIRRGHQQRIALARSEYAAIEYEWLARDRAHILNLVSVEDFLSGTMTNRGLRALTIGRSVT